MKNLLTITTLVSLIISCKPQQESVDATVETQESSPVLDAEMDTVDTAEQLEVAVPTDGGVDVSDTRDSK